MAKHQRSTTLAIKAQRHRRRARDGSRVFLSADSEKWEMRE
jgi:hypothetical protein